MRWLIFLALGVVFAICVRAAPPALPAGVVNTQKPGDKPMSPADALKRLTVPDGFNATLFAGEPDVMQPIAFDFDDRGRLWVVECFSYPEFKIENRDRIVIFTDKDGDGRFDERKVFLENGHRLSGIAVGFGGVWVTSAPNFLFYPDRDGDDVPDGRPEILLDGWTLKAGHNMVNGLAWGPDGWLYGRHGITTWSLVGKPGTPDDRRVKLSCCIWRYHPTKRIFEVIAHGTTNPWGLDWDDFGQPFFSNNVIGHLWHLIPGAHYERMFGEDLNPHVYALMEQTADHLHWNADHWSRARTGQEALGGGHSHVGAMIYLGDNWPREFRSRILMVNLHGNRVLYDELRRHGSGYVAKHGRDFLLANDPWFRGVQIGYGPDGGVFVSDWNDFGECHDSDGSYRASGRIYKITHGPTKPVIDLDLAKLRDSELVDLHLHTNDWHVRHARRLLQERHAAKQLTAGAASALLEILRTNTDVTRRLRALWTLHALDALRNPGAPSGEFDFRKQLHPRPAGPPSPGTMLTSLLRDSDEHLRWWAIQLACEDRRPSVLDLAELARLAQEETSPFVRLSLASALQRIPVHQRWSIANALVGHAEDAADRDLPLMIWYAIEPMVAADRTRALELARASRIPLVRQFIVRRLAAEVPAK